MGAKNLFGRKAEELIISNLGERRKGLRVEGLDRVLPWLGFARSSPPQAVLFTTIPDESCFLQLSLRASGNKMIQIDRYCCYPKTRQFVQGYPEKKIFQEKFLETLDRDKKGWQHLVHSSGRKKMKLK